jgi:membrane fusion protein, multidrug efflux system
MATTIAARDRPSVVVRVGRMFVRQLHGRSTLIVVLLVTVVMAVGLATIRNGASLGGITGRESTDDAYVRADQIAISSHIAGYVESIPVKDNETVRQGQLVATIEDNDYRAKVANAAAALEAAQAAVAVLSGRRFSKVTGSLRRRPMFARRKRRSNRRDCSTLGSEG